MKRMFAILVLVALAATAFAVTGKITARYGVMFDWRDNMLDQQDPPSFTTGWMFQYWGNDGRNAVDLWQGKECTGFDLNFEKLGITYKTRAPMLLPFGLPQTGWVDDRSDGHYLRATSPGYFQIRDVNMGAFSFSAGFAWWQTFAENVNHVTINDTDEDPNNDVVNSTSYKNVVFNRFYMDYKFNAILGDVTVKQYDWEMMHVDVQFGTSGNGTNTTVTNTDIFGLNYVVFVPLHVLFSYDLGFVAGSIDFAPQGVVVGEYKSSGVATKTIAERFHWKAGGTFDISMQFSGFEKFVLYMNPGFFWENEVVGGYTGEDKLTTNSFKQTTSWVVPAYLGLKFKLGPGIEANLGWGYNIRSKTIISGVTLGTTNTYFEMQPRNGYFAPGLFGDVTTPLNQNYMKNKAFVPGAVELAYYGDNFMDLAFLRFGGEAKFAGGNWSVGVAGGVALNDNWVYNWISKSQQPYSWVDNGTRTTQKYNTQLFNFMNFANYDRNMFFKYEDDAVSIKFTMLAERSYFNNFDYVSDPGANQIAQFDAIMGLFESVSITYKF